MARRKDALQFRRVELVLGAQENRGVLARLDARVQAVLDVAEVHRRRVQPQRGAQNDADLPCLRRRGRREHPLGEIRVKPDALGLRGRQCAALVPHGV